MCRWKAFGKNVGMSFDGNLYIYIYIYTRYVVFSWIVMGNTEFSHTKSAECAIRITKPRQIHCFAELGSENQRNEIQNGKANVKNWSIISKQLPFNRNHLYVDARSQHTNKNIASNNEWKIGAKKKSNTHTHTNREHSYSQLGNGITDPVKWVNGVYVWGVDRIERCVRCTTPKRR